MLNSESEKIEIREITNGGAFHGQHILILHDNKATQAEAPHLLDRATIEFLLKELPRL